MYGGWLELVIGNHEEAWSNASITMEVKNMRRNPIKCD